MSSHLRNVKRGGSMTRPNQLAWLRMARRISGRALRPGRFRFGLLLVGIEEADAGALARVERPRLQVRERLVDLRLDVGRDDRREVVERGEPDAGRIRLRI